MPANPPIGDLSLPSREAPDTCWTRDVLLAVIENVRIAQNEILELAARLEAFISRDAKPEKVTVGWVVRCELDHALYCYTPGADGSATSNRAMAFVFSTRESAVAELVHWDGKPQVLRRTRRVR